MRQSSLPLSVLCCLLIGGWASASRAVVEEPADPPGTVFVDDKDAASISANFKYQNRPIDPAEAQTVGGTVLDFSSRAADGGQHLIIAPELPKAGWYQVWIRWVTTKVNSNMFADAAPVEIEHLDGREKATINQRSGNGWVNMGTYRFDAGRHPILTFSDGCKGKCDLDAAKFIPADEPKPAPPIRFAPARDDFERLRQVVIEQEVSSRYGWGDEAEKNPIVRRRAREAERDASALWGTIDRTDPNANYVWLAWFRGSSNNMSAEANGLHEMATAYVGATNQLGIGLRGNPQLLDAILYGLNAFSRRYNTQTKWDMDWSDYEIHTPRNLTQTLILLGDKVPEQMRQNFIAAILRMTRDPRKYYNNSFAAAGANLLWLTQVHTYVGLLERSDERLKLVSDTATDSLAYVKMKRDSNPAKPIQAPDGFYADGSFRQHNIPYNMVYGHHQMEAYVKVAAMLGKTRWAVHGPSADVPFDLLDKGFDPFIWRGQTVPNLMGRLIGSAGAEDCHNAGHTVTLAASFLLFATPAQKAHVQSLIKRWVSESPDDKMLRTLHEEAATPEMLAIDRIIADPVIRPLPPRHSFDMFACMDQAMYRAGNFGIAISMNSTRTLTYETIWGANRSGWFESDGRMLIFTNDADRYDAGYWNLVDPYHYPGTTVERLERTVTQHSGGGNPAKPGGGDFVGGVTLGDSGVAAMHLKQTTGTLEARKAWFCFGEQVICLGAGIATDGQFNAETTVENARLIDDTQTLSVNGQSASEAQKNWPGATWAYLTSKRDGAGIGFVFLDRRTPLNTLIESRTGSRYDTRLAGDKTPMTMRFATLWLDHGKGKDGTYAYAVLPGRDADAVRVYATSPRVLVQSNTDQAQMVRDLSSNMIGLVAWQPGEYNGLSVDQPCIVVMQEQRGVLTIAVSDPTMKLTAPLHIKWPQRMRNVVRADDGMKLVSNSPLEIEVDLTDAFGATRTIQLSR